MLYWSLKTLSQFYQNQFDVIVFYDSDIENFKLENIHINNYNMMNDFAFVKFIKLDYVNYHRNEQEPFRIELIPWMFKWFCLEEIFNLKYENILFLDVDTVFYKNPIEVFNSLNKNKKSGCAYVNNGVYTELLSKRNIRNGLGINSGQFYLSNVFIPNFYNLYYKFRLELYKDCVKTFDKHFSEQWAGLMVFSKHKLNIQTLPLNLIKRGVSAKDSCIYHYEHQKLAYKILPKHLHVELKNKNI